MEESNRMPFFPCLSPPGATFYLEGGQELEFGGCTPEKKLVILNGEEVPCTLAKKRTEVIVEKVDDAHIKIGGRVFYFDMSGCDDELDLFLHYILFLDDPILIASTALLLTGFKSEPESLMSLLGL